MSAKVFQGLAGQVPSFQNLGVNSGLTNHGVVVAQGNSALVATSAGTSGHTLISGGASADPTFSAIGTNSGLTNRGVLLAQNNSAFVATTAGTAGQLFVSGGAGTDGAYASSSSADFTFSGALFATGNSRVHATLTVTQSAVTGDGTTATLICDSVSQSQGGSLYNTTTGVTTFDRTGWWMIVYGIDLSGIAAGNTSGNIQIVSSVDTWRPWIGNPAAVAASGNFMHTGSVIARFTSGNTCTVTAAISGTAAGSVSINQFTSYFMAAFLG